QNQNSDAGNDAGGGQDSGAPDGGGAGNQHPPQSANQDERMLDMLERAPTLQQEAAKNRALRQGPSRGMEDK
ncbi:MAG TPA: hypothetical protein PKD61_23325, partial [Polyangiaceae bacterium]|nr:hypothetical protein [Polyangiaceae bacterium]